MKAKDYWVEIFDRYCIAYIEYSHYFELHYDCPDRLGRILGFTPKQLEAGIFELPV